MNIFLYFLVYIDIPYDVINIIHALKQNINCFADPFKSYMKVYKGKNTMLLEGLHYDWKTGDFDIYF